LKSSSTLNMPIRFIAELLGRQICLASDLCTTAVGGTLADPVVVSVSCAEADPVTVDVGGLGGINKANCPRTRSPGLRP
jgi:hypothetical protein